MPHLTVQDLINWLDSVQRAHGGDILCWLVPGPRALAYARARPLTDVFAHGHGPRTAVVFYGPDPGVRQGFSPTSAETTQREDP